MKKSHKKLLIAEIIIFVLIILNSFISSILAKYNIVILLVLMLVGFKYLFGFEKDRHRYTKDVIFEILIILLTFFVLYYLSGVIFKYVKVHNYFTFYGIFTFIIPIILTTILKEYLRYNIIKKSEGSFVLIITTCLLFTFLDITNLMSIQSFANGRQTFIFIALTFLPALSNNIACMYISSIAGYKPNILWLLIIRLYNYVLPIVPNPNEYISSLILIILPLVITYRIYRFINNVDLVGKREPMKLREYLIISFGLCFSVIVVFLTSGYFKYYTLAIGSGSMSPKINIGDAVIIEKISNKNELKIGDVIAYNYHDVTMVHRIIDIVNEKNERYYYTKGDDNENQDNYVVYENMIVGRFKYKVPYIGMPSVWMNRLYKE